MVDQIIKRQELIDAKIDAQTLEDCINGAPDTKVTARLGRQYWTLSTIDLKLNYVQTVVTQIQEVFDGKVAELETQAQSTINEWQDAITLITANDGVPALAVADASGENQQQVNLKGAPIWYSKAGGYSIEDTVRLTNGDIVKSTIPSNVNNPNVDMMGWVKTNDASQIFDISGKNQQQINNANNYVYFAEMFGAVGDGVTDDTAALQSALNAISPTVFDTSVAVMNQKGGGGILRLHSKKYRITDTLWVGAYAQIVGSTELGFNSNNINLASCIVADFSDPLKPAISSSNFKAGGIRTAFDELTNGAAFDSGIISGTHGIGLIDFSVVAANGKRGFMGVRLQNSPQSRVKLYTRGFDYGVMANACWQSKFECRSLSYKCGLYLRSDNNACIVDGYMNSMSDQTPINTTNLITFFDSATDTDTALNELNKQFGFVSFGSFGLTGTAIVTELNDVGATVCMGSANIQTLYTEKNRVTGYCAYTNYSPVAIGNFVGAADQTCMLLGANSKTRILASRKTSTVGDYFSKLSRYNTELYVPPSFDGTYIRGIQYDNDQRILYVNASTGNNKNTGLLSNLPLLTLDEALARIITYSIADKNVTQPQKTPYTIVLAAGSYTISSIKNLYCDAHITTTETTNFPTLTFTSHLNLNESSNLTLTNINVIKPDVTGSNENACVWTVTGKNSFTINGGATQILRGGLIYPDYNGCSEVSLILNKVTVTGAATSQLVQTNFGNFAPHIVNFVRAGGSISAEITGRSDKGVSVPTEWQGKVLGL